jgi:hypothetical protein
MPPRRAHDKRHFSRVRFPYPAALETTSGRLGCEVLDLSLKGALVGLAAGSALGPGEPCSLEIRLDTESVIRMQAEVAHGRVGRAGLRWTTIDLNSICHLRRLLELNLGDGDRVHRELGALGGRPKS